MSERIAIIERCGQCEHGNPYSVPLGRCNHEAFAHLSRHKVINLKDPPPDWCPLPRGPVYQIPPTVWEKVGSAGTALLKSTEEYHESVSHQGMYAVRLKRGGSWQHWDVRANSWEPCESLEAGKAACEADHRARIAAALIEVKP